ncbi:MAG TPA: hypothetical protein VEK08_12585 [Planctomycetota bacterium]|nr:hypothetical protein [Planctomycetota bacterium]
MAIVRTFLFLIAFAMSLTAGENAFQPLSTELKVSGPAVSVRAPLGFRYRPGYAMLLEIRVQNPGTAFRGELIVSQGSADEGLRAGVLDEVEFAAQSIRVFAFPIVAPPVSADLLVILREVDSSGRPGPLRFQASLARVLKPLAPESRLVLTCGAGAQLFGHSAQQETVTLAARELPEAYWAYKNADLIILGDGSLNEASSKSKDALRRWLLSGGRIFLASNEALSAAIAAGLLPFRSPPQTLGADRAWWEKETGLQADDILAEKNNRPVYAKLAAGFGVVAFRFPGTSAEDAYAEGAKAINHPALQNAREKLPDFRVQPDRFNAFAFNAMDPEKRSGLTLWAGLGALVLCIGLVLGFSSRSRWVGAGWPLVTVALLAVLLARWFPTREISVTRISHTRLSPDRRCATQQEWTLVETFQNTLPVTVRASGDSVLAPLYPDSSEVRGAQLDLLAEGTQIRLQDVPVLPGQAALFFSSAASVPADLSYTPAPGFDARHEYAVFAQMTLLSPSPLERIVSVRKDGRMLVATKTGTENFDDWTSLLRKSNLNEDEAVLKGYATALSWASREALRSGTDCIIAWSARVTATDTLSDVEGAPLPGNHFRIWTLPVQPAGK